MKKIIFIVCFFVFTVAISQKNQLALQYFENGEFNKALGVFEELATQEPSNYLFFEKMIECYQQLEQYEKVEEAIITRKKRYNHPLLLIDLGYNYQLQGKEEEANQKYTEALKVIEDNPNNVYQLGNSFEKKVLVDWALKSYELAIAQNPNMNFDYQIALLQGQKGNIELMTEKLLDFAYSRQGNVIIVKNYLNRFIQDDSNGTFLTYLKKALILRTQKNPDIFWNDFLSWIYINQKEYSKAFIQLKAIYKRDPDTFENIISLANITLSEKANEDAVKVLEFIDENIVDSQWKIFAKTHLLKLKIETALETDYTEISNELDQLLALYNYNPFTIDLIQVTADFNAFYLNNTQKALDIINKALEMPFSYKDKARLKLKLADILVYNEKFNQGILYYAQVEDNMKNDVLGHEARMKMAKANYYKNDFDWALKQTKVLKQSSSWLIANDALELYLHIQDNSEEDSTRTALKAFSKADLKLFQNKKEDALNDFLILLENHKGSSIEDEALLKIGKVYTSIKNFEKALYYYNQILEKHTESIYLDEALFFSAEIYLKELNNPEAAKPLYEKIIFNHPDSIYFSEARKQFRILRGDKQT